MTERTTYLFERIGLDQEEARLDLLEEVLDPSTQRLLDRLGLPRGGRFLEVAAGHASTVSFLLARCGARGQVVATDIDTRWLDGLRHPNLTTMRHDLLLDELTSLGGFDVVHVRMLLFHLGSRADTALERLVTLVAPGGRLVVEDVLWDNRYDPDYPNAAALQAQDEAYGQSVRDYGMDMHQSVTFPRRFCDLGLTDVGNEIEGAVRRGGDTFSRLLAASITASGATLPHERVDTLLDPARFYIPWHRTAVWGTRPIAA